MQPFDRTLGGLYNQSAVYGEEKILLSCYQCLYLKYIVTDLLKALSYEATKTRCYVKTFQPTRNQQ
jgi:hypothetical protein